MTFCHILFDLLGLFLEMGTVPGELGNFKRALTPLGTLHKRRNPSYLRGAYRISETSRGGRRFECTLI